MLNKKLTKTKGCCIIKTKREDALINSLVMNGGILNEVIGVMYSKKWFSRKTF